MNSTRLWIIVAGIVGGLLLTVTLLLVASHFMNAEFSSEIGLPLLAILGVISLLASLTFVSVAFSFLNLSDRTQALALPDGSVRAVIALSLIIIFAITSIFFYINLADRVITQTDPLTLEQKEKFISSTDNRDILLVKGKDPGPFIIYYRGKRDPASDDFAKQVFTTLGTLVTAVASFYFGAKAAAGAAQPGAGAPTLGNVDPAQGARGKSVDLRITGSGLMLANDVRIAQGASEIAASNVVSNANLVQCTLALGPDAPTGAWDVVVKTSDGATARRSGFFTVTA